MTNERQIPGEKQRALKGIKSITSPVPNRAAEEKLIGIRDHRDGEKKHIKALIKSNMLNQLLKHGFHLTQETEDLCERLSAIAMDCLTPQPQMDVESFENGKHLDIVERLRGKVAVPITDGLGPVDGQTDFFERSFPSSNAAREAADYIEHLRYLLRTAPENTRSNLSEWRPIETAPKDGTEIFVWLPERKDFFKTKWMGWYWANQYGNGPEYRHDKWVQEEYGQTPAYEHIQPTHWMPLPPHPKDDE